MSEDNPKYFSSLEEWRKWLKDKHEAADDIWIIIQKKSSQKLGISYEEAVLEAVAHGWIDGKMKRLNDEELMQRFSPRKSNSVWSLSNRNRAEKLISETSFSTCIIEGENQSGKTSLLSILYRKFVEADKYPLFVDCASFKTPEVDKVLKSEFFHQYKKHVLRDR